MTDGYDDLFLALDKSGNKSGIGKVGGKQVIVIAILDEKGIDNPWLFNWIQTYEKVFVHELTHYFDDLRRKGKPSRKEDYNRIMTDEGYPEYYNLPNEVNAYFQEAASELISYFRNKTIRKKLLTNFRMFSKQFWKLAQHDFVKHLNPKNRRHVEKRIYTLYEKLVEKENKGDS